MSTSSRSSARTGSPLREQGSQGVGELDDIHLLIPAEHRQHRLVRTLGKAGPMQEHLHRLGGVQIVGSADSLDGGLAWGGKALSAVTTPRGTDGGAREWARSWLAA